MASFGEELKRERELRDISLKEISEATKISIRFLEALEQNNFDILPGGIFNRGFIRAYARFIGIDGEEMVNAYLHEVSLRQPLQNQTGRVESRGAGPTASDGASSGLSSGVFRPGTRPAPRQDGPADRSSDDRHGPAGGRRPAARPIAPPGAGGRMSLALWLLVIIAFLVGAGVITMSLVTPSEQEAVVAARPAVKQPSIAGVADPVDTAPAEAGSPPSPEPTPDSAVADVPPARPEEPARPSSEAGQPRPADGDPEPFAPPVPSPAPSEEPATVPPVPEHRVRVLATEATRVRIQCAERVTLDQELWPGQSKTVACAEPVVLSADNAGAVQYTIDGRPPTLLGGIGERVEGRLLAPITPAPTNVPGAGAARPRDVDAGT